MTSKEKVEKYLKEASAITDNKDWEVASLHELILIAQMIQKEERGRTKPRR